MTAAPQTMPKEIAAEDGSGSNATIMDKSLEGASERVIPNKTDDFGLNLIKNTKNRVGALPQIWESLTFWGGFEIGNA